MRINPSIKTILPAIVVTAMLILLGGTAKAQPPMRMSLDERIKSLTEQLSLTKVQADSIRKIYQQADSVRTKLFEARQGDRSGMRETMQKMQDSTNTKVERLLTKEQKEKFIKINKERRQRQGQPPPPPQDAPPPDAPPPNME
jgi:Spy/CpxP family protein refolding chaperone